MLEVAAEVDVVVGWDLLVASIAPCYRWQDHTKHTPRCRTRLAWATSTVDGTEVEAAWRSKTSYVGINF